MRTLCDWTCRNGWKMPAVSSELVSRWYREFCLQKVQPRLFYSGNWRVYMQGCKETLPSNDAISAVKRWEGSVSSV